MERKTVLEEPIEQWLALFAGSGAAARNDWRITSNCTLRAGADCPLTAQASIDGKEVDPVYAADLAEDYGLTHEQAEAIMDAADNSVEELRTLRAHSALIEIRQRLLGLMGLASEE